MESEDLLTKFMKDTMFDVISALYANGIRQVHLGGMMRLLGLPDSIAAHYDNDYLEITDEFVSLLQQDSNIAVPSMPPGTTIH